jgi:hypothetical protein
VANAIFSHLNAAVFIAFSIPHNTLHGICSTFVHGGGGVCLGEGKKGKGRGKREEGRIYIWLWRLL